jgi:hypothetical protein
MKIKFWNAFWKVGGATLGGIIILLLIGCFLRALDFSFWLQGR